MVCPECLKKKWLDELRSGAITREEFNRRMQEMRRRYSDHQINRGIM